MRKVHPGAVRLRDYKKQPSTPRDRGQGRGETRGHINTMKGHCEKWASAKGVEASSVDSQHILSLLGGSRHPEGSQEGAE